MCDSDHIVTITPCYKLNSLLRKFLQFFTIVIVHYYFRARHSLSFTFLYFRNASPIIAHDPGVERTVV